MTWPDKVLRQFEAIPRHHSESDFYGPYNKLLNILFPPDTDFTVAPQFSPASNREAADFVVMFEIRLTNKPVFILEVNVPKDLDFISTRQAADEQIRRRMIDCSVSCPIPVLHAVSAIGTRLCFYAVDTTVPINDAEIDPPIILPHPKKVTDTAPASRWSLDLLDADGEEKFRDVVGRIQATCALLS